MANSHRGSAKLKAVLITAAAAIILYVDFGRPAHNQQDSFSSSKAPASQTEQRQVTPNRIPHDYGWRDRSGGIYIVHEAIPGQGQAPRLTNPSLVAVRADVPVPYPADPAFDTRAYRLFHQATVSFGASDATVSDILIGETHLGISQIQVARTITDLLRRYEIDAVFLEQPDDLKYDWATLARLEQDRNGSVSAIQHQMIDDAHADLQPFLPYLKNAPSDAAALATIERRFGPAGRGKLEAALEVSDRYDKSEYVSAVDYYYAALRLQGRTLPFHNVESRGLRDQFAVRSASAHSIEELRGEIKARDQYMAGKGSDLIRENGYRQIIWIVGAEHLKSLPALLKERGHTVTIAYDSLATKKGNAYKKELMLLVKPDAFFRDSQAAERPTGATGPVTSAWPR